MQNTSKIDLGRGEHGLALGARQLAQVFAVASAVLFFLAHAASAQDPESHYRGKQIRLIVGSAPGGGFDAYARLLASHLGRHIPGNPTIIVQNMPGAGSLVLANHLYNVAPKDGTVIGAVNSLIATQPLFFPDRAKFDPRKMQWIGSILREGHVGFVWHTSPVKSVDDVFRQEVITAGTGGSTVAIPTAMNAILGTRFKVVSGYTGTKVGMLAMERGEVEGLVGVTWASLKAGSAAWIRENKIRVFGQFALAKHPELPNVPWIYDHVRNEDDRAALNLVFITQEFGRPYVVPPGVPESVLAALRSAFDATVKDAEFLAEAQRRQLDVEPTQGAEIQELVEKVYKTSPVLVERVKNALGDQVQ